MARLQSEPFVVAQFLANVGCGKRIMSLGARGIFFRQGAPADCVFYLQGGLARPSVLSASGKEATITQLSKGDFIGEDSISPAAGLRLATATAITPCTALRIERAEMVRVVHEENTFSDFFVGYLLNRSIRTQADLVNQLFNSSEKRLARVLLLMAHFGPEEQSPTLIPKISQDDLAQMVGTTRSRVSFFMNRFRKLGFVEYNDRIRVHKSLLNVVLHDHAGE